MANAPIVKQSVTLAVLDRDDRGLVLLVRRPEDDEEFPGMWGLPAASCRPGEAQEQAALRIGRQKLGVELELGRRLCHGHQERPGYSIEMVLFEAWLKDGQPHLPGARESDEGVTIYIDWRWGEAQELTASAQGGSLCSRLLLEAMESG